MFDSISTKVKAFIVIATGLLFISAIWYYNNKEEIQEKKDSIDKYFPNNKLP
ncbi:MAG: hypothetical protein HRT57_15045 [Crocinitomicaceae bacterium]|nr:hypothetical protein [Crocinitomicaceae bacterium]